jgi:AcrR family transcriptional regulator
VSTEFAARATRAASAGGRPVYGRRSRAEAARTRARILDRAERLFARKGYRAVSTRELARACRVHPYTIQHHFGSKLSLYGAVLCRWDDEIRALSSGRNAKRSAAETIGELLDFLLAHGDWVALNIRHRLGEGLPADLRSADRSWADYIAASLGPRASRARDLESRLLLVTAEGILYSHVISQRRYRALLGSDLADPRLRRVVKQHVAAALQAIVRLAARSAGARRR